MFKHASGGPSQAQLHHGLLLVSKTFFFGESLNNQQNAIMGEIKKPVFLKKPRFFLNPKKEGFWFSYIDIDMFLAIDDVDGDAQSSQNLRIDATDGDTY